ncbi:hypothetical protein FB565_000207 [Actinoplanes lutulentus]|uniref:Uncharacterized protein n=1 Tax=Actinoplanes lutulentus TaxID=1287878 RepID=A0A327YWI4_9ACTN|nr:hypothetical protein [Actinoplanes lutulentus]MBB2940503.1 hypothetical protein [Actinoplanes lutulentus]RAK25484.1 hypothetical protein B0I29_13323 [Actinoplanes lutulentus]
MFTALALIHDGALATGIGSVVYSVTVATAAFTALLAPSEPRRRDPATVLRILLRSRRASEDQLDSR